MKVKVIDNLPKSWDDVTYEQSLKLMDCKDTADTLGVFVNIEPATLRRANIPNLDEILRRLAFLNQPPPEILPRSINGFLIPIDLNFKSICRFEDLKEIVLKIVPKNGEAIGSKHMANYPAMVGIYAMPNYEGATPTEREQFAKQFFKSQAGEVLAIGNFTLRKFKELTQNASNRFPHLHTLMHKLRLVLRSFSARLAFSVRFFIWKKRHHINATNS